VSGANQDRFSLEINDIDLRVGSSLLLRAVRTLTGVTPSSPDKQGRYSMSAKATPLSIPGIASAGGSRRTGGGVERYRPFANPLAGLVAPLADRAIRPGAPDQAPVEQLTFLTEPRLSRASNSSRAVRFAPALLAQLSLAAAGRGGNA